MSIQGVAKLVSTGYKVIVFSILGYEAVVALVEREAARKRERQQRRRQQEEEQ